MKLCKLASTYLLLACVLCFQPVSSATLHAIIAADIEDESIGEGTVVDLQVVHGEVQKFALYADMELIEIVLTGSEYKPHIVVETIDALEVGPDDVVIYYHLAHGFRTPSTVGPFPVLYFGYGQWSLNMQDIINRLKRMPQRLTIAIADVCNNSIPMKKLPRFID